MLRRGQATPCASALRYRPPPPGGEICGVPAFVWMRGRPWSGGPHRSPNSHTTPARTHSRTARDRWSPWTRRSHIVPAEPKSFLEPMESPEPIESPEPMGPLPSTPPLTRFASPPQASWIVPVTYDPPQKVSSSPHVPLLLLSVRCPRRLPLFCVLYRRFSPPLPPSIWGTRWGGSALRLGGFSSTGATHLKRVVRVFVTVIAPLFCHTSFRSRSCSGACVPGGARAASGRRWSGGRVRRAMGAAPERHTIGAVVAAERRHGRALQTIAPLALATDTAPPTASSPASGRSPTSFAWTRARVFRRSVLMCGADEGMRPRAMQRSCCSTAL